MRRMIALITSIALVISLLVPSAFATGMTMSAADVESDMLAGEQVKVDVSISNNSGFVSGNATIEFDKDSLKLVGIENETEFFSSDAKYNGVKKFPIVSGTYKVSWEDDYTTENITTDGRIVTLIFEVLETATPGKKEVRISSVDLTDGNAENVTCFGEPGSITLTAELTGLQSVAVTAAPALGKTPDAVTANGGAYFDVAFSNWQEQAGGEVTKFEAGKTYTATITLTPKTGYKFADSDVSIGVSAAKSTSAATLQSDGTLTATCTFVMPDKAVPTITTAPTASAITYGETLYKSILSNGAASVEGTFKWKDTSIKPQVKDSNTTEYEVVFTPTDTASYETATCKVKLEVKPKELKTLSIIPIENQTYTGEEIRPKVTVKDGQPPYDELAESDYSVTYSNNTNVGKANVKITAKEGGNYTFNAGTFNFEIKAATSAISITGDPSKTYDGSAVTAPAVKKSGSTGEVTYTYYTDASCTTVTTAENSGAVSNGAAPKNAGTYWVKATLAADSNHGSATSVAKQFTISPKPLTADMLVMGTQATYDGASHAPVYSVKDGDTALEKDVDYTETEGYIAVTSVGNTTLKITGKGNYTGVVSKDWSLVAKDISQVTIDVTGTYTYTGDAITPAYTVKDGDTEVEDTNYTLEITNNTNAGTATIKLTGKGNYQGTKTATFTISAKDVSDLTVEAPAQTVVKGDGGFTDPVIKGVKGEALAGTFTYAYDSETGKNHADVVAMLKNKAADTNVTLSYTFTPDSTNNNYTGTMTGSFAVTVKDIEFKVGSETASAANALTIKAAPTYGDDWSDIVKIKDDVTITAVAGANTDSNKEHFSLRPTGKPSAGEQTYELIYNGTIGTITYSNVVVASGMVTVAPKTLTKNDLTYSGPITKVYDSTTNVPNDLTVSVRSGSLVGNDTLTVTGTLTYNSANVKEASSITFTPVAITTDNYRLAASEVLTITGAKITAKDVTLTGGINATDRSYEKDNKTVDLTKGTLAFTGLVGSEMLDVSIPATGTISDAKVGTYNVTYSGVTLADNTGKASNYALVSPLPTVTVTITKADAPTLADISVNQKYTVTTAQSKDIGRAGMPADAGTLTYAKGTESKTGSVTITGWDVDSTGKVTYTLSGGAKGDTVTLPVTIKSTNYADSIVKVVITLTERDVPEVKANDITVDYTGEPVPASMITGTAIFNGQTVEGSWSFKDDDAKFTTVADSNGSVAVVFTPADTVNYASVEYTIKVTINKAKPTGTPGYTAITAEGKTLADAGLNMGTITLAGTIKWVAEDGTDLADDTAVEANKSYSWVFTPNDTDNYETLTGSIQLWHKSTGGRYYYSSSNSSGTATITAVLTAKDAKSATDYTSGIYGLTFRSTADFSGFKGVKVDGKTIGKDNYVAESNNGSIEVYLKAAYLKTLAVGRHTLTIMAAGGNASIDFTIGGVNTAPKTFDAGIAVYVTMAVASVTGMAWMGKKRED